MGMVTGVVSMKGVGVYMENELSHRDNKLIEGEISVNETYDDRDSYILLKVTNNEHEQIAIEINTKYLKPLINEMIVKAKHWTTLKVIE